MRLRADSDNAFLSGLPIDSRGRLELSCADTTGRDWEQGRGITIAVGDYDLSRFIGRVIFYRCCCWGLARIEA